MTRSSLIWVAVTAGCADVMPPPQMPAEPRTAVFDEGAAQELKAFHQSVFDKLNAGDVAGFRATIASDEFVGAFDLGPDGKPVRVDSPEAETALLEQVLAAAKSTGAGLNATIRNASCRATATFGICSVEFDFATTTPDGRAMALPMHGTSAARKGADGWKWLHWHASLAATPPAPPPPAPPLSARLDPAAANAKELRFMDLEGFPAVRVAPLWQHPQTRAMAAMLEAGKLKSPPHQHSSNALIFVEKGMFSITGTDGNRYEAKAGGFVVRPANWTHVTECKPRCTVAIVADGPMDMAVVDDKGGVGPFGPMKLVPLGSHKAHAPAVGAGGGGEKGANKTKEEKK